jgi:orotate phosphoribosyltransferase
VASGVVTYSRNGQVFFTSSGSASPLFVDVALYDLGATIENVMIATVSAAPERVAPAPTSRAGARR